MTALQALTRRGRDAGPRAALEGTLPLTDTTLVQWLNEGLRSYTGKRVTETSALEFSAVYRAVTLISGTLAGLTLHGYTKGPGGARVELPDADELAELLDDPHPDMTPFELWELVYGSLLLWGNAYLRILRDPLGRVRELWWVNPGCVKAGRADDGTKVYVIDRGQPTQQIHTDDTMLHIPGFGYDGVCGVSVIRAARHGIGVALAAEEYGGRLFGNGSLATGVLQTEQRIDVEEASNLKRLWKAAGTGLESAHDVRVIGSGAKFHQLTIPPEDAQFLQTREFQVTEVARWFGLPPHMLAQVDKSTSWGTGIEAQQIAMVVYTFANHYRRVEQRLTKLSRRMRGNARRYVRVGVEGLLRGDSAARSAFYQVMFGLGALSTNEIRALEDLPPVEGGDVRYRPLNLGVLGEPDPSAVDPTPGDQPAESPAAQAARIVQQLYLGVGKVLRVDEARAILRSAGVELDDLTAAEVFAEIPPMPPASAGGPPGPLALGSTRPRRQAVAADQLALAIGDSTDA